MKLLLKLVKNFVRNSSLNIVLTKAQTVLNARFGVKGYKNLNYINKRELQFASDARQMEQFVGINKSSSQLPPSPQAKQPWPKERTPMRHLYPTTFQHPLQRIKHALIKIYAVCFDFCEGAKPECVHTANDTQIFSFRKVNYIAAVKFCKGKSVRENPNIKYFSSFNNSVNDHSCTEKMEYVSYLHTQMSHSTQQAAAAATTAQAAGYGSNVQLSFDSDFEQTIANVEPTFVMFYASWCSHCSEVKPNYSKLATKVKESNVRVKIIAIDAAENPKVADLAGIQTLPTFKIFKSGKELALYEGDRSMEDMLKFCQTYTK